MVAKCKLIRSMRAQCSEWIGSSNRWAGYYCWGVVVISYISSIPLRRYLRCIESTPVQSVQQYSIVMVQLYMSNPPTTTAQTNFHSQPPQHIVWEMRLKTTDNTSQYWHHWWWSRESAGSEMGSNCRWYPAACTECMQWLTCGSISCNGCAAFLRSHEWTTRNRSPDRQNRSNRCLPEGSLSFRIARCLAHVPAFVTLLSVVTVIWMALWPAVTVPCTADV